MRISEVTDMLGRANRFRTGMMRIAVPIDQRMNQRLDRPTPTNILRSRRQTAWTAFGAALLMIGAIGTYLLIRSIVIRPPAESNATTLGLKYDLSKQDPAI